MFRKMRDFIEACAFLINIETDIYSDTTLDELIEKYSDGSEAYDEFIRETYRKTMLKRMGA